MNKIIFAAALLLLFGCSNPAEVSKEKTKETAVAKPQDEGAKSGNEKNAHESAALELNDGKKWKLDDITRKNIASIKSTLADTTTSDPGILATKLTDATDKLVSECRMKGEDHEALHHWLEKWLKDLKDLKTGTDKSQAIQSLKADARDFDLYFE